MRALCFALVLLGCSIVRGATFTADNGNISFNSPDGFTELTPEEIALKFPMKNGTMSAVGNENRTVSISYSVTQNALRPDQLGDMKTAVASMMEHFVPNLQWVKNDYIDIAGRKWAFLESITPAADRKIHNIEIVTSYRGIAFIMNFNSDEELFDANHDKLWASLKSVKLNDITSAKANLPSSTVPPVSADEEVTRGQLALEKGDLNLAKEAFAVALHLQPDNQDAVTGLNQVNARLGEKGTVNQTESKPLTTSSTNPEVSKTVEPTLEPTHAEVLGWSPATFAIIGSSVLIVGLTFCGAIVFFTIRGSKTTPKRASPPINRPPPMR